LQGSLGTTLKEVRPHVFLGVPRVWEKMQETMVNAARTAPALKRRISRWAKGVGYKSNYSLMKGYVPFVFFCRDQSLDNFILL
jgi:long-subunit acyl-CoA synthetase (AMP-forming)